MTRFYSTGNWQAIRRRHLARQPLCEGCSGVVPATEVDHIVPIKSGGAKRDPSNLQSLCRPCHQEKTRAETDGKTWTPAKLRGCFPDGSPRDPQHPWFTGGKGGFIATDCAVRPAGGTKKRLVETGSQQWD
jgi:5-methylcytosine-specific restriction enzyme A